MVAVPVPPEFVAVTVIVLAPEVRSIVTLNDPFDAVTAAPLHFTLVTDVSLTVPFTAAGEEASAAPSAGEVILTTGGVTAGGAVGWRTIDPHVVCEAVTESAAVYPAPSEV